MADGEETGADATAQAPLDGEDRVGDVLPLNRNGEERAYRVRKTDRREEIEDDGTPARHWIVYAAAV